MVVILTGSSKESKVFKHANSLNSEDDQECQRPVEPLKVEMKIKEVKLKSFLLTLEMMQPFEVYDTLVFTVETGKLLNCHIGTVVCSYFNDDLPALPFCHNVKLFRR